MKSMHVDNSYHDEKVHKNVEKTIRSDMDIQEIYGYTVENDNVLKREDSETGFAVKLHFSMNVIELNVMEEVQKILIGAYLSSLKVNKGE